MFLNSILILTLLPHFSMYALSTDDASGEVSRNFTDWNREEFLERLRVRIGAHNLVKDGDYVDRDVLAVVIHPEYSRSTRPYNKSILHELAMHGHATASRPRLSETEPKCFVFETS